MKNLILLFIACPTLFGQTTPDIVLITVDTLRADRLSAYGYPKNTTPNIDKLLAGGALFMKARTSEPLTAPSLITMLTSLHPHEHAVTRNGLHHRAGLTSISGILREMGYQTTAFVSNWTLKNRLTGLAEHFDNYVEVLHKKRWFGLFHGEADASDLSNLVLTWLKKRNLSKPHFLWVHYSDPHAPYRLHPEYKQTLGIKGEASKSDRYDSEIAFTDYHIGRLLTQLPPTAITLFSADHGESLGEHGYWGHGRHLYESTLHIPMSIIWPGHIARRKVKEPALLLDLAPTILGLLNRPSPASFRGKDWSSVLLHNADERTGRVTCYQAHKGAVLTKGGATTGRIRGLLEVAVLREDDKELFRIRSRVRKCYNLSDDPEESQSLVSKRSDLSAELRRWALEVERGLFNISAAPAILKDSDVEMLRSLGYIE